MSSKTVYKLTKMSGLRYQLQGPRKAVNFKAPEPLQHVYLEDALPFVTTENYVLFPLEGQYVHKEQLQRSGADYSDAYADFAGLPNTDHIHSLVTF